MTGHEEKHKKMFEDILNSYEYKLERLVNSVWVKAKMSEVEKGDTFRYIEAPHRRFEAREKPFKLDNGIWVVMGVETT